MSIHVQHASYEVSDHYLIHLKAQSSILSHQLESPKSNWEIFIMYSRPGKNHTCFLVLPLRTRALGPWFCPLSLKLHPQRHSDSFLKVANVCTEKLHHTVSFSQRKSISKIPQNLGAQWLLFILSFSVPSVWAGSISACIRPLRILWISHEGYGVWLHQTRSSTVLLWIILPLFLDSG